MDEIIVNFSVRYIFFVDLFFLVGRSYGKKKMILSILQTIKILELKIEHINIAQCKAAIKP